MLAAEKPTPPHIQNPKPTTRRPLQPKNTIPSLNPITKDLKKHTYAPIQIPRIDFGHSNKENCEILANPIGAIDASLAEELIAVKKRLERLRLDREKTEKMLQDRDMLLDFRMFELEERGEFQKELEIEVDRLYRLKELKLSCMRMSPIRSLREKEMEKKIMEPQFESAKSEASKEKLADESSTTESLTLSLESSTASTSASASNSTATSKVTLILPRLSSEVLINSIEVNGRFYNHG